MISLINNNEFEFFSFAQHELFYDWFSAEQRFWANVEFDQGWVLTPKNFNISINEFTCGLFPREGQRTCFNVSWSRLKLVRVKSPRRKSRVGGYGAVRLYARRAVARHSIPYLVEAGGVRFRNEREAGARVCFWAIGFIFTRCPPEPWLPCFQAAQDKFLQTEQICFGFYLLCFRWAKGSQIWLFTNSNGAANNALFFCAKRFFMKCQRYCLGLSRSLQKTFQVY